MSSESFERRGNQRILTRVPGRARFWLSWYGGREALSDLSVEGFAMPASTPPASDKSFEFLLEHEGSEGGVNGRAQVVNFIGEVGGGLAGCRFVDLAASEREQIAHWLAEHVVTCASVPLSAEEAEDIVRGPSIV